MSQNDFWTVAASGVDPSLLILDDATFASLNAEETLSVALDLIARASAEEHDDETLPATLEALPPEDTPHPQMRVAQLARMLWRFGVRLSDTADAKRSAREMLWRVRFSVLALVEKNDVEDPSFTSALWALKDWLTKLCPEPPPLGLATIFLPLALSIIGQMSAQTHEESPIAMVGWLYLHEAIGEQAARRLLGAAFILRAEQLPSDAAHLGSGLLSAAEALGASRPQLALVRHRRDPQGDLDALNAATDDPDAFGWWEALSALVDVLATRDPSAALGALLEHLHDLPTQGLQRLSELAKQQKKSALALQALTERGVITPSSLPIDRAIGAAAQKLEVLSLVKTTEPLLRSQPAVASRKLRDALRRHDDPELHAALGAAHEALGQTERALASFQRALAQTDEPDPAWLVSCGRLLLTAQQHHSALEHLRAALQRGHETTEAFFLMVLLHLEQDDLAGAERWLDVAAERLPDDPELSRQRHTLAMNAFDSAREKIEREALDEARGYLDLSRRHAHSPVLLDAIVLCSVGLSVAEGRGREAEDELWGWITEGDAASRAARLRRWAMQSAASGAREPWLSALLAIAPELPAAHPDDAWSHAIFAFSGLIQGDNALAINAARQGVVAARMQLAAHEGEPGERAQQLKRDLASLYAVQTRAQLMQREIAASSHTLLEGLKHAGADPQLIELLSVLGQVIGADNFDMWLQAAAQQLDESLLSDLKEGLAAPLPVRLSLLEDIHRAALPLTALQRRTQQRLRALGVPADDDVLEGLMRWLAPTLRALSEGQPAESLLRAAPTSPQPKVATPTPSTLVNYTPNPLREAPAEKKMRWQVRTITKASDAMAGSRRKPPKKDD